MALNGLHCAYVPLRNYSLTHDTERRAGLSAIMESLVHFLFTSC